MSQYMDPSSIFYRLIDIRINILTLIIIDIFIIPMNVDHLGVRIERRILADLQPSRGITFTNRGLAYPPSLFQSMQPVDTAFSQFDARKLQYKRTSTIGLKHLWEIEPYGRTNRDSETFSEGITEATYPYCRSCNARSLSRKLRHGQLLLQMRLWMSR